jgi:hypothetical protein
MSEKIIKKFQQHNKILFGPFLGEFGWEISRWSGFVRWYCKNYPDKQFVISTREGSKDFYYNLGKHVKLETFTLKNDYTKKIKPSCYRIIGKLSKNAKNHQINYCKNKYLDYYIFHPFNQRCKKNLFHKNYYDFNFELPKEYVDFIKNIKDKYPNRKLITIAARHRKDITRRNWKEDYWEKLFNFIEKSDDYYSIILGNKNSIYYSNNKRKNILYLSDLNKTKNVPIGLTIETMKQSELVVAPQTGSIILANAIGIPTLFWGHEIKRHAVMENYSGVRSKGLVEKSKINYITKPNKIYNEIKKMTRD